VDSNQRKSINEKFIEIISTGLAEKKAVEKDYLLKIIIFIFNCQLREILVYC